MNDKKQEIINETIADMKRENEEKFKAAIRNKLNIIASLQAQLKGVMKQIEAEKVSLKELQMAEIDLTELT